MNSNTYMKSSTRSTFTKVELWQISTHNVLSCAMRTTLWAWDMSCCECLLCSVRVSWSCCKLPRLTLFDGGCMSVSTCCRAITPCSGQLHSRDFQDWLVYGRVRSIASLDGETTHQKDWTDSGHVPAKWGFDTFLRVQIWKPTSYCTVYFWTKFSENFFWPTHYQ